jgi:hypothetical protein
MNEAHVLHSILETFRHSGVSAFKFLHYARIGVLLTEETEELVASRMSPPSEEDDTDTALAREKNNDRIAAEGWAESAISTSTEGAYLLAQLRRQLQKSVCDLYAFSALLDFSADGEPTPALARLVYPSDEVTSAWSERLDQPYTCEEVRSHIETFPREQAGLLVVPKP